MHYLINLSFSVFYSIALTKQNFTLKYDTNIPRQVVSFLLLNMIFKINLQNLQHTYKLHLNRVFPFTIQGLAGSR